MKRQVQQEQRELYLYPDPIYPVLHLLLPVLVLILYPVPRPPQKLQGLLLPAVLRLEVLRLAALHLPVLPLL